MKALTFQEKTTVLYESVPDPEIKAPGDVIVKVHLAGICGSDLHVYHAREQGLDRGTVMGHEFLGEVVETGSAVKSFRSGDIVFSPFTTNCGRCFYCRQGLTCRCLEGQLFGWVEGDAGLHGAQAELVRVPLADSTLLALPPEVTPEEALLLGDILSTGFYCADMAEVNPGGVYAVLGCGPVGLMAIAGVIERGANKVFALDSVPQRLNLARDFGAFPVDYQNDAPLDLLREHTEGRGADAVLEVVGSPAATRLAFDLVRPGGIVSAVGVHTEENFAFSPVEAYDKNLTYRAGRCPARHYMERLVGLVQRKKYDFASIISHNMPLKDGARGYEIFDKKIHDCTKVVLSLPS